MKQIVNLQAGQSHFFNGGNSGKFLIMRECTQPVLFIAKGIQPIEVQRSDSLDVRDLMEMELRNHGDNLVHIEFQITDIEVRIKDQSAVVENAVTIDEIQTPIDVNRILEPVNVTLSAPVIVKNIETPVEIQSIKEPVSIKQKTVTHHFSRQNLKGGASWSLPPDSNIVITSLQVIANPDNTDPIDCFGGISVYPGTCWEVNQPSGIDGTSFFAPSNNTFVLFFTYDIYTD